MKIILIIENEEHLSDGDREIRGVYLSEIAHIVAKEDGTILKDRHNDATKTFLNQAASILKKMMGILPKE